MSEFAESFAGRHVTVISSVGGATERTDTGTIVRMSENWVQVAKDNGEMLLFPTNAIRVMKLLDAEPAYTVPKTAFADRAAPLQEPAA